MPNDDDGQDHMFRFIPLKEVDRSAPFGEVATLKVLHDNDHQVLVVDRQKRACSFCAVSEPHTEMSPGQAVMIRLTSIRTWNADISNRFQHSKLKQWLNEVRIFTVSADNVSK